MRSSSRRSVRPSIRALFSPTYPFAVLNGACNGYCTPKNTSEPSYHVRVSIPSFHSPALTPPIALRCLLPRRNLQIHNTRHNRCSLCGTGLPAPSDILPRPSNAILIFRPGPDKQLHREPICGLNTAAPHSVALYQYGRRHTELASSNYTRLEPGLAEGVVFETRGMDPLGHCNTCCCYCDIGGYCRRVEVE